MPVDPFRSLRPERFRRDTAGHHRHLRRLLPRARSPAAAREFAGPAAGRSGALHDLRDAPAHALPGGAPAPARPSPRERPALPAHDRPGRGRRLHPPHRLPDARVVVPRRLRRPTEPAVGLRTAPRRFRHRPRPAARDGVRRRRPRGAGHRLVGDVARARRTGGADRPGELVVQRADRSVRPRLGDLPVDRRHPAGRHSGDRRAVDGGLEPRADALPPAGRRPVGAAAAAERRHRDGSGAPGDGAERQLVGLRGRGVPSLGPYRHRPVAPRRGDAAPGRRPPPVRRGRPRRRGPSLEHRSRVRAAPADPPDAHRAVAGRPVAEPRGPAGRADRGHPRPVPAEPAGRRGAYPARRRGATLPGPAAAWPADRLPVPVAGPLRDEDYRRLHDTYGLPRDLVDVLVAEAA